VRGSLFRPTSSPFPLRIIILNGISFEAPLFSESFSIFIFTTPKFLSSSPADGTLEMFTGQRLCSVCVRLLNLLSSAVLTSVACWESRVSPNTLTRS